MDSSLIASTLDKYGEYKMIFNDVWILSCVLPIDLEQLCLELKDWIHDNQGLFVSELVNGKANGWLPVTVWDWYKSNSDHEK